MKKQTENTTQDTLETRMSEPPAVVGGLTQTPANDSDQTAVSDNQSNPIQVQPPATAGGSDIEVLRAENEQLKASIQLNEAHRQITGELEKAGARSPGLLFDSIKADLQFADDGQVANAAALIEKLKTGLPEQFGSDRYTTSIDAGAGVARAPRLTREALAKMKTEEIAALDWADVKRVLSQK